MASVASGSFSLFHERVSPLRPTTYLRRSAARFLLVEKSRRSLPPRYEANSEPADPPVADTASEVSSILLVSLTIWDCWYPILGGI
ncbi:hypothetical protein IEQ34_002079 [Dendrobium chrysotoxum]|uniref:Uncharacterized protein n=1 Tax=Dendrobium chrysotoxum TaxID=161865 RepID=A0AAV7HKD0_DENCH|nr:hypothetical protein IEQ34_002079 [Dendrobium chrysotoxum]